MEYPFCNGKLTVEYILWDCKESEKEKRRMEIHKEIWTVEKEVMKKLVDYGFYQGIC
jgi:hypothetical protein